MAYHLEGRLLEVCNCYVLCPCWNGEDPDFGTGETVVAWHFDSGKTNGSDVAGQAIAMIAHVPGNVLQRNWKTAVYLDQSMASRREAWRIGVEQGLFCVGGRSALMLIMFVVGMGKLGLMLALAVVMAAQKNLPWGRRLRTPLGLALIGAAAAIAAAHA
jgi:hypothetical protein